MHDARGSVILLAGLIIVWSLLAHVVQAAQTQADSSTKPSVENSEPAKPAQSKPSAAKKTRKAASASSHAESGSVTASQPKNLDPESPSGITAQSAAVPANQPESSKPFGNGPRKHNKNKSGPTTTVVREGGVSESNALLLPSMTQEQAASQRQHTNLLIAATEASLQKLSNRQLTEAQQSTRDQIRAFVQQSKDALDIGDIQRGHNLALKARMLSDDLVQH